MVKIVALIFLCISSSACITHTASETRNPLDTRYQEVSLLKDRSLKIQSTHIAVGTQDHRNIDFVNAGYNQGGLIGYITHSIVAKSSNSDIQDQERLIQPIRNAMLEYNYGSKLRAAVERGLGEIDWLHVSYVAKYPNLQRDNVSKLLKDNSDDTLLIVDSGYSFAPDYNSIKVICYAAIHSKNKSLPPGNSKGSGDTLVYQKKFSYTQSLNEVHKNPSSAIQRWSENKGALVVQALDTAVTEITRRMAADIKNNRS